MGLDLVPDFIRGHYCCREWNHAVSILHTDFPNEFSDVMDVLTRFRLKKSEMIVGGGSKSKMAGWIDGELTKLKWLEKKFDTSVIIDDANPPSGETREMKTVKKYGALALGALLAAPAEFQSVGRFWGRVGPVRIIKGEFEPMTTAQIFEQFGPDALSSKGRVKKYLWDVAPKEITSILRAWLAPVSAEILGSSR